MMYGERLKLLRERMGYTQKEIASLINILNSTYCDYEKENQTMPLKYLIFLCQYYKVSLDYIFNFTNNNSFSNKDFNRNLVGTKIKEFRKSQKITQNELAKLLNTTHSVIADYESNRYLISTSFLYTICKKYHISADYLLGLGDNQNIN